MVVEFRYTRFANLTMLCSVFLFHFASMAIVKWRGLLSWKVFTAWAGFGCLWWAISYGWPYIVIFVFIRIHNWLFFGGITVFSIGRFVVGRRSDSIYYPILHDFIRISIFRNFIIEITPFINVWLPKRYLVISVVSSNPKSEFSCKLCAIFPLSSSSSWSPLFRLTFEFLIKTKILKSSSSPVLCESWSLLVASSSTSLFYIS